MDGMEWERKTWLSNYRRDSRGRGGGFSDRSSGTRYLYVSRVMPSGPGDFQLD